MVERHGFERSHEQGVFARILEGLAAMDPEQKTAMINATYLKTHRTATSLRVKKGDEDLSGRPVGAIGSSPMGDGPRTITNGA